MLKAVAINPICLSAAVRKFSNEDFLELAVVAFSHHIFSRKHLFGYGFGNGNNNDLESELDFDLLCLVAADARERVVAFEGYTKGFLFGMVDEHCALSLLNQDPETSTSLKDLIAGFTGVPLGRDLGKLRAAAFNLPFMCTPDPEDLSVYFSDDPSEPSYRD